MKAQALAVFIVGSFVAGAAGKAMPDIYGIAMAPVSDATITHPGIDKRWNKPEQVQRMLLQTRLGIDKISGRCLYRRV
ncbi:hypothetical protein MTO96_034754 [Rhipicephalus appendiculatus]